MLKCYVSSTRKPSATHCKIRKASIREQNLQKLIACAAEDFAAHMLVDTNSSTSTSSANWMKCILKWMGGLIELAEYGENPENIKIADVIILKVLRSLKIWRCYLRSLKSGVVNGRGCVKYLEHASIKNHMIALMFEGVTENFSATISSILCDLAGSNTKLVITSYSISQVTGSCCSPKCGAHKLGVYRLWRARCSSRRWRSRARRRASARCQASVLRTDS